MHDVNNAHHHTTTNADRREHVEIGAGIGIDLCVALELSLFPFPGCALSTPCCLESRPCSFPCRLSSTSTSCNCLGVGGAQLRIHGHELFLIFYLILSIVLGLGWARAHSEVMFAACGSRGSPSAKGVILSHLRGCLKAAIYD